MAMHGPSRLCGWDWRQSRRSRWGLRYRLRSPKIVVATVAPWILGVTYGISRLQSGKQRNQFPGTGTTLQLKSKPGRCAIADLGFAMSCVFGATRFLQPAAEWPGKRTHYV